MKRKVGEQELQAIFREIAKIGFQEVEPRHAVYTIPLETLRGYITDSGLTISSGHFEYDDLTADVDAQLRYAKTLGLTWVVYPMLPKPQWSSAEGFKAAAHQFNDWANRAHDMGMKFAFHNHIQRERWYFNVKTLTTLTFHLVSPAHHPGRRVKRRATRILKALSRL